MSRRRSGFNTEGKDGKAERPVTVVRPMLNAASGVLLCLGILTGAVIAGETGTLDGAGATAAPSPTLSPQDVVKIQLEALRSGGNDGSGIEVCYRFASPANKAYTGPLQRFGDMIEKGDYSLMLRYRQAVYETMEVLGSAARQRVTLYGDGPAMIYTFYLSRQSGEECSGCWMTEAVTAQAARGQAI